MQKVDSESGCYITQHGLVPPPPCFRYTDESRGTEHEIFVTTKQYWDAVKLHENQEWEMLSKYPPYSDRPPRPPRLTNVFGYTDANNTTKQLWLPPGDESAALTAYDLSQAKKWDELESRYEPYSKCISKDCQANLIRSLIEGGQKYGDEEENEEWARGVERCRKAREEDAAAQAKTTAVVADV